MTLHDVHVGRLRIRRPTNIRVCALNFRLHVPRTVTRRALRATLGPARTRLCPADERGRHERLGAGRPTLYQGVAVALQIHANVLKPGITKHSLDFGDERGARHATRVRLEIVPHGRRNLPERDDVGDRQAPPPG